MKQINFKLFLLLLAVFNSIQLFPDDRETVTAVPANDFLNTIGVNSAIYARGENMAKTIECCKYIGARWVRGTSSPTDSIIKFYNTSGIKVSCGVGSGNSTLNFNLSNFINNVKKVAASGALLAIEGANEPNNWAIRYNDKIGGGKAVNGVPPDWLPIAKLQRDIYESAKAAPELKDYPVWSISANGAQVNNVGLQFLTIPEDNNTLEMPAGTHYADYANCHNYFVHNNPYTDNQTWRAADPGTGASPVDGLYVNYGLTWNKKQVGYSLEELLTLPRVTTETGVAINVITDYYQGLMYVSTYLAQFKRGWSYTSMYILRDRTDETGNQTFGFFDPKYNPRPAATYLHNLTTVIADNESAAAADLKELTYSISPSRPATVHELLLQKKNGTLMLIVWGEKYISPAPAPTSIEVKFDEPVGVVNVYNVLVGTEPVQSYTDVTSIPLDMLNYPYILEINPVAASLKNPNINRMQAYPNPVDDVLYLSSACKLKKAALFDLTGKCVLQAETAIDNKSIHVEGLPKGSYILKLTDEDNQTENFKIIKK